MVEKKNTIFISFSSKDIGEKGFVQAVANAIYSIDYEPDHMDCGVKDSNVNQDKLDERILRSRLVIMVLDQQYKDCENLRHEFEVVTERGRKITTLIFIKECLTPEETKNQKENIFNVLNIGETRYIRFKNADDLYKKAKEQLNIWYKKEEEEERRKEEGKKKAKKLCLYTAVAVLVCLLFCLLVPYIKEGVLGPETNGDKIETPTGVKDETPTGGKNETSEGVKDKTLTGGKNETPVDVKDETHTGDKGETPTDKKDTVGTTGKKPIPEQELSVMAPNTFAVTCDDELLRAGISDAVSQVLPSLSQSVDTSKAQWTISVKRHVVQEIPKMIDSDALQVDVDYTVDIINNANNKKSSRLLPIRGRSIIQNRDDAIRNANEEATKEIANILKSMQQ